METTMIENIELKGAAVAQNVAGVEDRAPALQINLVHHVPGRLRFRSAALRGDARTREVAHARLSRIKGVTSVAANPITGSLLVEYDPATLAPASVIEALANQGYAAPAEKQSPEPDGGWADRLANAVGAWILDALVERLVLVMIGALA
jgi:Heavy metal associated domain 2